MTRQMPIQDLNVKFGEGFPHTEHRSLLPKMRRFHDSKRQRVEHRGSSVCPEQRDLYVPREDLGHNLPRTESRSQCDVVETGGEKRIDLSSCHICHRKPTVRSELDAFADCEGCARRTCYICIRECLGSDTSMSDAMNINVEGLDGNYDELAISFTEEMAIEIEGRTSRIRNSSRYALSSGKASDLDPGHDLGGRWECASQMTKHKGMVCSRCCVERGTEGEVWCMGCLRAEDNA